MTSMKCLRDAVCDEKAESGSLSKYIQEVFLRVITRIFIVLSFIVFNELAARIALG